MNLLSCCPNYCICLDDEALFCVQWRALTSKRVIGGKGLFEALARKMVKDPSFYRDDLPEGGSMMRCPPPFPPPLPGRCSKG